MEASRLVEKQAVVMSGREAGSSYEWVSDVK